MKLATLTLIGALAALPAWAEITRVPAKAPVEQTMDALEAAVTKAGATVFARVNHATGAASVDMDLDPAQLLIFGNPKIGTPAMQDDPLAGLQLPLRVLVYQDADGSVYLAYEGSKALFDGLNIPADAAYAGKIDGALGKLTGVAAGN